ncbi:MAG: hypothetical protein ACKOA8_12940, partial [Deltaproteobacteria bacterium]
MKSTFLTFLNRLLALLLTFVLTSCQFGFMSFDEEKAPQKQALNFSEDPALLPSRILIKSRKAELGLTLCEPVDVSVATAVNRGSSIEVRLKSSIVVNLEATGQGGNFYTTSNCSGASMTSIPMNAGESRKLIYYKPTNYDYNQATSNPVAFSASSRGFTSEIGRSEVKRVVTALRFNGNPSSANVGVCASGLTVTSVDGLGNPFTRGTETQISLGVNFEAKFYTGNDCVNETTSISIPANNTTTGNLSFKVTSINTNSRVITSSLAVSDPIVSNGTSTIAVTRTATALTFDSAPATLNVGVCSASFTVTSRDGLGNPFSENNKTVNLSSASNGQFFTSLSDCQSGSNIRTSVAVSSASPSAAMFFK